MKAKRPLSIHLRTASGGAARPTSVGLAPQDAAVFLDAMRDVRPLDRRDRVPVPPKPASPIKLEVLPPEVKLTVEGDSRTFTARAPGVSLSQVAALRAGNLSADATLDLHGQTVDAGVASLRAFLVESRRLGRRRVLIVHGKGLHSDHGLGSGGGRRVGGPGSSPPYGGAPLRDAVLADLLGPSSGLVHAFASAAPKAGGDGATYVMLRGAR